MVAMQIRDVPVDVRDDLAREAQARGVSLQVYLRGVIEREARAARNRDFLRTLTPVPVDGGFSADDAVALIAEGRAERDRALTDSLEGTHQP